MAIFIKCLSFPFILFSEKVNASLSDLSKTQSASVDSKGREKGDNRNLCLRELGWLFLFLHHVPIDSFQQLMSPQPHPLGGCLQHLQGATQAVWQQALWVVSALRMGVMKGVWPHPSFFVTTAWYSSSHNSSPTQNHEKAPKKSQNIDTLEKSLTLSFAYSSLEPPIFVTTVLPTGRGKIPWGGLKHVLLESIF